MSFKIKIVLGLLLVSIEHTSSQKTIVPFCFEGDCYIKLENNGKSWPDAQEMCKNHSSTLPIVDNPDRQRNFVTALYNFSLSGTADVWLGAKASEYDSGIWRWLDGSQYSITALQDAGSYDKSYAFLSKKSTPVGLVLAYASVPYNKFSYICQYNTTNAGACTNDTGRLAFVMESRCYVKYFNAQLSWFNARNECLNNDGDLASFSNISLLEWIINSTETWVGLRHSQWNWHNAVTGTSSEVTFTSWRSDQPNDATPTCISIDNGSEFPNWKDWKCSEQIQYICQVVNPTSTLSTKGTHSSELSTTTSSTATASQPMESPGSADSKRGVNVPLAIGLGVGLGTALIIAIVIVIIVIIVRRKHRNRGSSEGRRGKLESENVRISQENETKDINENSQDSKSSFSDTFPMYAMVQKAKDPEPASHHTASSFSQSQLDDASHGYATVQETSDLEPISHDTTSIHSQSQLGDASPKYGVVQKARDIKPTSQHNDNTSESLSYDGPLAYAITVQETKDFEPISQDATSSNFQSRFDDTSPKYGVVQKDKDLDLNLQDTASTSDNHLDDVSPDNQEPRDQPTFHDTTSSNGHSQLDDNMSNYGIVQKSGDLEPDFMDIATDYNEPQLIGISPVYATVQDAEGIAPYPQTSLNQGSVYADLDFCQDDSQRSRF